MITTRAQLIAAFAVLMAFGWWITAQPPFSAAGTVGILVAGGVLIALARLWRRRSDGLSPSDEPESTEGLWVWVVILLAILVWELVTFVSHPREMHPTVSSIMDTLQTEHVVRWVLFGGWLAIGWSIAA